MENAGVNALNRARACWNAGDLDGYLGLYAQEAVLHGYVGVEPGFANIKAFYEAFFTAFPGSRLEFEDVLPSGNSVTCRFVVTGTHEGPFQGLPPTHKAFHLPGITILRFEGSRCVERWSQADFLSLLQQLGALAAV